MGRRILIKVTRVEQQIIKRSHPKYKFIDEMCFKSKNLYNYANYIIRQEFINNKNYIQYKDLNKKLKSHEQYKDCMSQPANCVLRLLDKNWKSFFKGMEGWKKDKSKYLGMPRLPNYLKKDGRYLWMIPNNTCYIEGNELHFRIRKLQDVKWYCRNLGRLIQVRFIPKGSCYVMEIVYEIEIECDLSETKNIASIDLGVDNLVTMTNNIGLRPIIINGKGIKSINQYYNKQRAKEMSSLNKRNSKYWSNKLDKLTFKRFCRIKNYMHHTSNFIVKYCKIHNIDTLVVGINREWKQESLLSKKVNQNFVQLPYDILLKQLNYKCQDNNINYIETDESYTSGTSFIDDELPIKENYNKKRRIVRGLFKSNKGVLINSDVNGSLQIMKKVFPNAISYGIEVNLTPIVINTTVI